MKAKIFAVAVFLCFGHQTFASKVIDLNIPKSKKLYQVLDSLGTKSTSEGINLRGVSCKVQKEAQQSDPAAKTEYLVQSSCGFDGDSNLSAISNQKADQLISVLSKIGFKLGKPTQNADGISEKSLFIQTISCSKAIEIGQTEDLQEKIYEVYSCSVEI